MLRENVGQGATVFDQGMAIHSIGCALPKWASALSGNMLTEGNFGLTFCPKPGTMTRIANLGADLPQMSYIHASRMCAVQMEYLMQVSQPCGFARPQKQVPVLANAVYPVSTEFFEYRCPAHYAWVAEGQPTSKKVGVDGFVVTRYWR